MTFFSRNYHAPPSPTFAHIFRVRQRLFEALSEDLKPFLNLSRISTENPAYSKEVFHILLNAPTSAVQGDSLQFYALTDLPPMMWLNEPFTRQFKAINPHNREAIHRKAWDITAPVDRPSCFDVTQLVPALQGPKYDDQDDNRRKYPTYSNPALQEDDDLNDIYEFRLVPQGRPIHYTGNYHIGPFRYTPVDSTVGSAITHVPPPISSHYTREQLPAARLPYMLRYKLTATPHGKRLLPCIDPYIHALPNPRSTSSAFLKSTTKWLPISTHPGQVAPPHGPARLNDPERPHLLPLGRYDKILCPERYGLKVDHYPMSVRQRQQQSGYQIDSIRPPYLMPSGYERPSHPFFDEEVLADLEDPPVKVPVQEPGSNVLLIHNDPLIPQSSLDQQPQPIQWPQPNQGLEEDITGCPTVTRTRDFKPPPAPPLNISAGQKLLLQSIQWPREQAKLLHPYVSHENVGTNDDCFADIDAILEPLFIPEFERILNIYIQRLVDYYAHLIFIGKLTEVSQSFNSLPIEHRIVVATRMGWPSIALPPEDTLSAYTPPTDASVAILTYSMLPSQLAYLQCRWLIEARNPHGFFSHLKHILRYSPHCILFFDALFSYLVCNQELQHLGTSAPYYVLPYMISPRHPDYQLFLSLTHFAGRDINDERAMIDDWNHPEGNSLLRLIDKPYPEAMPEYTTIPTMPPKKGLFKVGMKLRFPAEHDCMVTVVFVTAFYALVCIDDNCIFTWNFYRAQQNLNQVSNFAIIVFSKHQDPTSANPSCCVQGWIPISIDVAHAWGDQTTVDYVTGDILLQIQPRGRLLLRLKAIESYDCGLFNYDAWPINLPLKYRASSFCTYGQIIQYSKPEVHIGLIHNTTHSSTYLMKDHRYCHESAQFNNSQSAYWKISLIGDDDESFLNAVRAYPCHMADPTYCNRIPFSPTLAMVRLIPGKTIRLPISNQDGYYQLKTIPAAVQRVYPVPAERAKSYLFQRPFQSDPELPFTIPQSLPIDLPLYPKGQHARIMFVDTILKYLNSCSGDDAFYWHKAFRNYRTRFNLEEDEDFYMTYGPY